MCRWRPSLALRSPRWVFVTCLFPTAILPAEPAATVPGTLADAVDAAAEADYDQAVADYRERTGLLGLPEPPNQPAEPPVLPASDMAVLPGAHPLLAEAEAALTPRFPGRVAVPNGQLRVVAARQGGVVERLIVAESERVASGQVLARLQSPDLISAQRSYREALTRLALAESEVARERMLHREGVIAERRLRESLARRDELMGLNQTDSFLVLAPREDWRFQTKEALITEIRTVLKRFPGLDYAFTQPIEMRVSEMLTGVRGDASRPRGGPAGRYGLP